MSRSMWPLFLAWLTAAFLWPAEAAVNGDGLPYVVLLGLLAVAWPVVRGRFAGPDVAVEPPGFSWADAGVVLLAAGHWLSTWWVFRQGGDCRSALNLSFEWFGLATCWFALRAGLREPGTRVVCLAVLTSVVAGIAVLGVWQHHVEYGQRSEWYVGLRTRLDQLEASNTAGAAVQAEQIRSELRESGALWHGSQRDQFEQRLLHSTEALGTFALANTLAGVLVVPLLLLVQAMLHAIGRKRLSRGGWAAAICCSIALLYCLVLTKSRSAWLGAAVGLGVILAHAFFRSRGKTLLVWSAVSGCVVLTTLVAGLFSGAIDREVVLETPRSLQYRLFYWIGTAGVLAESPVFGTGPGNFRQSYLQHKLPESSEAIADPHNLFLDAWVSAGVVGLCGLLLVLGVGVRQVIRPAGIDRRPVAAARISLRSVLSGMLIGFCLPWGVGFVTATDIDILANGHWIIPAVAVISLPAMVRVYHSVDSSVTTRRCHEGRDTSQREAFGGTDSAPARQLPLAIGAATALVVHLLAAGSLQFPILVLLLFVCTADIVCGDQSVRRRWWSGGRAGVWAGVAAAAMGTILVLVAGAVPVTRAQLDIARGVYEQTTGANPAAAAVWFEKAATADPWSVDARQRQAALQAYYVGRDSAMLRADVTGESDRVLRDTLARFDEAAERWRAADRGAVGPFRLRAQMLFAAGDQLGDTALMQRAMDDLIEVVRRFPTSVRDWLTLAQFLSRSPELNSAIELEKAVNTTRKLDRMNREWGHTDLYLTEEEAAWLATAEVSDTTDGGISEEL